MHHSILLVIIMNIIYYISLSFSISRTIIIRTLFHPMDELRAAAMLRSLLSHRIVRSDLYVHTHIHTNISLFKARQPEFKTDFSQTTLYHRFRNKIIFILI